MSSKPDGASTGTIHSRLKKGALGALLLGGGFLAHHFLTVESTHRELRKTAATEARPETLAPEPTPTPPASLIKQHLLTCTDSNSKRKIVINSKCPVPNSDKLTWRSYNEEEHLRSFAQADHGAVISFYEKDKLITQLDFTCKGLTENSLGLGMETTFVRREILKKRDNQPEIAFTLSVAQEESNPEQVDYRYLTFQLSRGATLHLKNSHPLKNWDNLIMKSDEPGISCTQ